MQRTSRVEWVVALVLTLAVLCLHALAAASSGALWRDEAQTAAVATLPRLGDVWRTLQYESFPILWLIIVRAYSALFGPMNDPAFRALGFFVGVGVAAALWLNARTFRQSAPLLSLVLLAMCPNMIRWGDTLRAYGFGILLSLLTCALLWRFVEKPSAARFAAAAVVAVASVQVLYFDAVFLLAFCSGGFAVCAYRRAWKSAGAVVLVGLVAAISLLPYANTIREASIWNGVVRMPDYTLAWFWTRLAETVSLRGSWMPAVWASSLVLAVTLGFSALIFPKRFRVSAPDREVILYSLAALVVGLPGIFVFLRILSYPTQPWYYLGLLALAAVCMEAILGVFTSPTSRTVRLAVVVILAATTLHSTEKAVRSRLTNVDLVTAQLERIARPGDIILVAPWEFGVSFQRYYRGTAEWMTVPPIEPSGFHRYDLLLRQMRLSDQTLPAQFVTDRAREALQSGHRVFVAGERKRPEPGVQPKVLPPAPATGVTSSVGEHERQWYLMVSQFLTVHAVERKRIALPPTGLVSHYEDMSLRMLKGWR